MAALDESVARTLKFTGKSSSFRFLLVLTTPLDGWIRKYPVQKNQPEIILVMFPLVETEDMNPPVKIEYYLYEYCMLQYSSKNKMQFNVFTRLIRMSDISRAVINKMKQFRRSDGNPKGENSIYHSPARYSHSSETVRDYLPLFQLETFYIS